MLGLWLPLSYWNRDNISALITYLEIQRSPVLKKFTVILEGYKDGSGKLLSFIQKVIQDSADTSVVISQMGYLAEQDDSFQALGQYVEKAERKGETRWDKPDKKGDAKASA